MDRFLVTIAATQASGGAPPRQAPSILASPRLIAALGLAGGRGGQDRQVVDQQTPDGLGLRFGSRRAAATFRPSQALPPGRVLIPADFAERLVLETPLETTIFRGPSGEVVIGPLVGLLLSGDTLAHVLAGGPDEPVMRYVEAAEEVGAALFLFRAKDIAKGKIHGFPVVTGYCLHGGDGDRRWRARTFPIPNVVYDRCLGGGGRREAAPVRDLAAKLHFTVLNAPAKIAKLQTYRLLSRFPELAPHVPFAAPLTPANLRSAMDRLSDIYLKPNALYRGKGVKRLIREEGGWVLLSRGGAGTSRQFLASADDVARAVGRRFDPLSGYLLQEGLRLATYYGNRFDIRSLVQKDGAGRWIIAGQVARIAPGGSPISSPRSGGEVARLDLALRAAFPDRHKEVQEEIDRVSIAVARRIEQKLGPCAELGLDLGVLKDGTVKLIEVNGRPLKVSLERLRDPLATARMYRLPIHYAAFLDSCYPGPASLPSEGAELA